MHILPIPNASSARSAALPCSLLAGESEIAMTQGLRFSLLRFARVRPYREWLSIEDWIVNSRDISSISRSGHTTHRSHREAIHFNFHPCWIEKRASYLTLENLFLSINRATHLSKKSQRPHLSSCSGPMRLAGMRHR